MGMAVMVKLTKMWENKSVSSITKLRLMNALVWLDEKHGRRRRRGRKKKSAFRLLRTNTAENTDNSTDKAIEQVYKMAGTESELLSQIKS